MSSIEIRRALQDRLLAMPDGLNAASTAFEGVPFTSVAGQPFQSVTLIPGTPLNPTLGDSYYREVGYLRVRLFYPSRVGVLPMQTQAEKIRDWFFRGLSLTNGAVTCIIERTPRISSVSIPEDDRLMLTVEITYFASVFN